MTLQEANSAGRKTESRCENSSGRDLGQSRIVRLICICGVLLLCVSCATEPRQVSPPVQMPDRFSDSGSGPLPDKWWTALDDAQLAELVERSLEGNFSLKAAWDRLDQARALARQRGAPLWPQLDGTASGGRSARETEVAGSEQRIYADEYSLGLTTSYEVDVWGRVRANYEAGQLNAQASSEDLQAAALSLTAQVANAWYRLVEQYAQRDLLERQITTNKRYLQLVELRFRKGEATAPDVLQQRKLVESTRTEKSAVKARLETLRHQLAVLVGSVPRKADLPSRAKLPDLPSLPKTGVPAKWLRQRPDIYSAYLRVQSRDRELAAAIADQYPTFRISGNLTTSAAQPSQLVDQWLAKLAGNMTAPLLDGGRREAEVDRQKAALSESLHNYAQTVLTGVQEVEDALTNETQQRETVAGLLRQLELSNRTVVQLWDRYTNGTSGFLRVLDELRTQQRLQREVLAARAQLVRDRVDLYRTLGGTWKLNRPQGSPAESLVNETDSGSEPSEESESAQEYEHGGAHS